MSDPFIAEIKMFGGNFAPRGYAFCNGQILPIAQNAALFSLLGTTFGGDGRVTFGLPNLQGRSPLGPGQGPGLSSYVLGQQGGADTQTLISNEMPSHTHQLRAAGVADAAGGGTPGASKALAATATARVYRSPTNLVPMGASLAPNGGGQPHNNRQPYQAVSFIIALQGIFPARS